jgi:excisionase family DNA binding protein
LRVEEYARAIGVSKSTVYAGIKRGQVKSKMVGHCRIIFPDKQP